MSHTDLATAVADAFHAHATGDPANLRKRVRDVITSLPEVDGSDKADAIHGPWQVEAIDAAGRPVDVFSFAELTKANGLVIQVIRTYQVDLADGVDCNIAHIENDFRGWEDEEIQGEYLRALAMCAGLNLASLANGIHITPEGN